MMQKIDNISDFLRQHDIKPSFQRMKIYEHLHWATDHPTVDDIYRHLVPGIPTLSKTTVYNTLALFIEKGIALQISIDDNESRYDAKVYDHGHFKCQSCGAVIDFDTNFATCIGDALPGCKIEQRHMYLKGICSACQAKNNQ